MAFLVTVSPMQRQARVVFAAANPFGNTGFAKVIQSSCFSLTIEKDALKFVQITRIVLLR